MNIPTAEEFLDAKSDYMYSPTTTIDIMIEFAKLHVEAALKEASESRCIKMLEKTWYEYSLEPDTTILARINITVNKDSILNSYPLTNIK
jgi:hypothetical protein